MRRKTIRLGLVILNTGILGGMLLPAFSPPRASGVPMSQEDQVLLERLTLATKSMLGVMAFGLIVVSVGIARREPDKTGNTSHSQPLHSDGDSAALVPAGEGRRYVRTGMIAIKPHHFVDIITAFGDGCTAPPPHPYGHAVHSVTQEILADCGVDLRMELGADDICRPCGHNLDGLCVDTIDTSFRPEAPRSKREWNLIIDQRWSERLGLRQDDQLTARELCLRIRDRAGDITDIYREIPFDRTAARQAKLQKGIDKFLQWDW